MCENYFMLKRQTFADWIGPAFCFWCASACANVAIFSGGEPAVLIAAAVLLTAMSLHLRSKGIAWGDLVGPKLAGLIDRGRKPLVILTLGAFLATSLTEPLYGPDFAERHPLACIAVVILLCMMHSFALHFRSMHPDVNARFKRERDEWKWNRGGRAGLEVEGGGGDGGGGD